MLPSPALNPIHDEVVWLYVYNDFDEGDADRAATRIRIRWNVSSWPQLLLVDPVTLDVIGQTGRTEASFLANVRSTSIDVPEGGEAERALQRLRDGEALARRLETEPSTELASAALESTDVVARFRAVAWLRTENPNLLIARAAELLSIPNDLLRYEVLRALASAEAMETGQDLRERLHSLLQQPRGSRNPNVLRIHTTKALARLGDSSSLALLHPFAVDGALNNGLTGAAMDAAAAIGSRDASALNSAVALLLAAFPEPALSKPGESEPGASEREQRMATALARRLYRHLSTLTGRDVPFPETYDNESLATLRAAFSPPDEQEPDHGSRSR